MCRIPFPARSMRLYPTNPFQYATSPAFCSVAFGPLKYSSITAATGLIEERISLEVTLSNEAAPLVSRRLSVNTIFTFKVSGVVVTVTVAVLAGLIVGVLDEVTVTVADGVIVKVFDGVIVAGRKEVPVAAAVEDGVLLGVFEAGRVIVGSGVRVTVAVEVRVAVGALEGVLLGVDVGAGVTVGGVPVKIKDPEVFHLLPINI
jgi:hypothetical protein